MKHVFIVGAPRSGTTLLQSMLLGCSEYLPLPETHLFRVGWGRGGEKLASFGQRRRLLKQLAADCGIPTYRIPFRVIFSGTHFALFALQLLDTAAQRRGKCGWIEKTPEHVFYTERIARLVPDVKFIHITRSGPATIASIVEMWSEYTQGWGPLRRLIMAANDIVQVLRFLRTERARHPSLLFLVRHRRYVRALELWRACTFLSQCRKSSNYHVCAYEDLVLQPEATVREICKFLSIEYSDSMLNFSARAAAIIRPSEVWKKNNLGVVNRKMVDKVARLDGELRDFLQRYARGPGVPTPSAEPTS